MEMITRSQIILRWCGILFGRRKEQDEIEVREVKIILLQERERGKGSGMRGVMEAMGECVLIAVSATLPASRSHEYISRPIPQINPSVHRDLDAIDSTVIFCFSQHHLCGVKYFSWEASLLSREC